ncbi:hypothetical protein D9M68_629140 [compost metagenome]
MPAVQKKAALALEFDDVRQRHPAFHMALAGIGGVVLLLQHGARQQMPQGAVGGAPAGQLARLRRAVNLVHRCSAALLGARGEFGAQRRGGGQAHVQRRPVQIGRQQGR